MATFDELRAKYSRRQKDALIDTIATGLSHADDLMLDPGVFDGLGAYHEVLENVSNLLPFVLIVATEGGKVLLGRKKGVLALKNAVFRSVKSGAAMAVGAGVIAAGGGFFAVPTAMTVRVLFDRYKSKAMLGNRMDQRIQTLRFLRTKWETPQPQQLRLQEPMEQSL